MGNGCSSDGTDSIADDGGASQLIDSTLRHQREHSSCNDSGLRRIRDQNYDTIRQKCALDKELWTDPLFPASAKSLYLSGKSPFPVEWKRPKDLRPEARYFTGCSSRRFDLAQGQLGDCWLLPAVQCLAHRPELLAKVIPDYVQLSQPDVTGFEPEEYTGAFRFRFFHYGDWIEVVVDDQLPVYQGQLLMVHSAADPAEFWAALTEKAYAKLLGSYESAKVGGLAEALTDLTGGVCETIVLDDDTAPFQQRWLQRAIEQQALLCAGIWGDTYAGQTALPNGLVTGHAYSVVGFERLELHDAGRPVCLLRLRAGRGGRVDWQGRWAHHSVMWTRINRAKSERLRRIQVDDGEFWMDWRDAVHCFGRLVVCHLPSDDAAVGHSPSAPLSWHSSTHASGWLLSTGTAGGRFKYRDTFHRNPQFDLQLYGGCDARQPDVSLLIELTQKQRRRSRAPLLCIGFVLFKLSPDQQLPVDRTFFDSNKRVAGVDLYASSRAVTERIHLAPGRYLVIASTWSPLEEGHFQLRVWSDQALHECHPVPIDRNSQESRTQQPTTPRATTPIAVRRMDPAVLEEATKYIRLYSGSDMRVSAAELQAGLNKLLAASAALRLEERTCRALICVFDRQSAAVGLHWHHFYRMYEWIRKAIHIYNNNVDVTSQGDQQQYNLVWMVRSHDAALWPGELLGDADLMQLAAHTAAADSHRATGATSTISFDAFVRLLCRLELARDEWSDRRNGAKKLCLTRRQLMQLLLQPV